MPAIYPALAYDLNAYDELQGDLSECSHSVLELSPNPQNRLARRSFYNFVHDGLHDRPP